MKQRFVRKKVADDGAWVTDGDLDVGFELDACALERGRTFLEDAVHGVELTPPMALDCRDGILQHEAVTLPAQPITIPGAHALVPRKLDALVGHRLLQIGGVSGECMGKADIEQIKAGSELNHGTDNGRFLDVAVLALRLLNGPLQSSLRSVFPEVNATSKPVIGVLAGDEFGLADKDFVAQSTVAAVEGEDSALIAKKVHGEMPSI